MKTLITTCLLCLATLAPSLAEDGKYHDKDVVLDEAIVPPYDIPPVLVSSEGRPITTAEEWFHIRRPQIMSLFGNLIYGIVPAPELPIQTTIEVLRTDPGFMGGKATRKDVKIKFANAKGSADMTILVFTPNGAGKPVPAILQLSFANTKDDGHDAHPEKPGFLRCEKTGSTTNPALQHRMVGFSNFQRELKGVAFGLRNGARVDRRENSRLPRVQTPRRSRVWFPVPPQ